MLRVILTIPFFIHIQNINFINFQNLSLVQELFLFVCIHGTCSQFCSPFLNTRLLDQTTPPNSDTSNYCNRCFDKCSCMSTTVQQQETQRGFANGCGWRLFWNSIPVTSASYLRIRKQQKVEPPTYDPNNHQSPFNTFLYTYMIFESISVRWSSFHKSRGPQGTQLA